MAVIAQNTKTNGKAKNGKIDIEKVQKVAYQLFVERGYAHGHDQEDWLRAEEIVRGKNA